MVQSRLRRPAPPWARRGGHFPAPRAAVIVKFTSPTTTTTSGCTLVITGSRAVITFAVCSRVASGTHLQRAARRPDPQLLEEDLAHWPVVVLAGVNQHHIHASALD